MEQRVTQLGTQVLTGADPVREQRITQLATQVLTGVDPNRKGRVTQLTVQVLWQLTVPSHTVGNVDIVCAPLVQNIVQPVVIVCELSSVSSLVLSLLPGTSTAVGNIDCVAIVRPQSPMTAVGNIDCPSPGLDICISGAVAELSAISACEGQIIKSIHVVADLSASCVLRSTLGAGAPCLEPSTSPGTLSGGGCKNYVF